jgi:hypothetical protein
VLGRNGSSIVVPVRKSSSRSLKPRSEVGNAANKKTQYYCLMEEINKKYLKLNLKDTYYNIYLI